MRQRNPSEKPPGFTWVGPLLTAEGWAIGHTAGSIECERKVRSLRVVDADRTFDEGAPTRKRLRGTPACPIYDPGRGARVVGGIGSTGACCGMPGRSPCECFYDPLVCTPGSRGTS